MKSASQGLQVSQLVERLAVKGLLRRDKTGRDNVGDLAVRDVLVEYCVMWNDQAGNVTWYTMPAGNWTGNTYNGTLYATTGSPWLGTAYNPALFGVVAAGSVSFNFQDADHATLTYSFLAGPYAGTTQVRPLVRQPY